MSGSEFCKFELILAGIFGRAGGEVVCRGKLGLFTELPCDCFCKLPDDIVDLNGGALFDPTFVSPATVSLANAVNDLLLLLVFKPVDEAEYW